MDSIKTDNIVTGIFTEYMREHKLRRTPERYAILNAIYSKDGSFEIEELVSYLEENEKFRVSRATVYNTIALLINANLVTQHRFGSLSKYEKSFGREMNYAICTKCGKMMSVNNIHIEEELKTNIKKFHLTHYSLYIYGLCPKCHRTTKKRKQKTE